MLSFKAYRKLNESFLGLGPTALGFGRTLGEEDKLAALAALKDGDSDDGDEDGEKKDKARPVEDDGGDEDDAPTGDEGGDEDDTDGHPVPVKGEKDGIGDDGDDAGAVPSKSPFGKGGPEMGDDDLGDIDAGAKGGDDDLGDTGDGGDHGGPPDGDADDMGALDVGPDLGGEPGMGHDDGGEHPQLCDKCAKAVAHHMMKGMVKGMEKNMSKDMSSYMKKESVKKESAKRKMSKEERLWWESVKSHLVPAQSQVRYNSGLPSVMEDKLIEAPTTKKKEPGPGEVGYAPSGRIGGF
jgi:hypothetical protein